jgi:PAS domain S-box-containing protein
MALFKHGMEEELREREQTIHTLLDAIPDALFLINHDRKIIAVNDAMARRLGKRRDDLRGAGMADLVRDGLVRVGMEEIEGVFLDHTPISFEEEHAGRWFRTSVYPTGETEGGTPGIAVQSQDITEMRELEEKVKREGLSQIEENMEQFTILNDQIRNPLQVIAGYAELVDPPVRTRIEEQVRIVDDLVGRLDKGWIESEKVRSFLIRHLRHGEDGVPWACRTRGA